VYKLYIFVIQAVATDQIARALTCSSIRLLVGLQESTSSYPVTHRYQVATVDFTIRGVGRSYANSTLINISTGYPV